ncbi:hypothetical protein E1295_20035 [Nonomuraea mesophila]|uniref:Uncharacterized protein n=1 Tax=Nonomuraea mesophila TaxID=2530382 RepID=A0A4R5FGP1_9ACTN|nr:hypothetical protein [Nonomuraea mesophila]TDE49938.1 hypothetical protein E1295_20035 [Nonomuraea mesophila]
MTKPKNSPDWTLGLSCGLAMGMGFAAALSDLLLGISMSLCFGVALSYAFGSRKPEPSAAPRP